MGKRKRELSKSRLKKKLRKLAKCLRDCDSSSSESDNGSVRGHRRRSPSPVYSSDRSSRDIEILPDSDTASPHPAIRSSVHIVDVHREDASPTAQMALPPNTSTLPIGSSSPILVDPSTNQAENILSSNLPDDILEILGEPKEKQEVFGPKIQEEISERWGRILCEGLNKDQKKVLGEKIRVPQNFLLVKAPKLNPEISAVLIESTRNRDKRLESAQNYLGLGISALTALISSLIDKDVDKMDVIKQLSEINQILLDLHFLNTINRRKLIAYSLDKRFQDIVQDVKRDSLLFGENLSDKIKATKSAEKTGLQLKKTGSGEPSSSKKMPYRQGNFRGPPRQPQHANRQGGTKNQPYRPTSWRRPPAASPRSQDRGKEQRSKAQPPSKQQ